MNNYNKSSRSSSNHILGKLRAQKTHAVISVQGGNRGHRIITTHKIRNNNTHEIIQETKNHPTTRDDTLRQSHDASITMGTNNHYNLSNKINDSKQKHTHKNPHGQHSTTNVSHVASLSPPLSPSPAANTSQTLKYLPLVIQTIPHLSIQLGFKCLVDPEGIAKEAIQFFYQMVALLLSKETLVTRRRGVYDDVTLYQKYYEASCFYLTLVHMEGYPLSSLVASWTVSKKRKIITSTDTIATTVYQDHQGNKNTNGKRDKKESHRKILLPSDEFYHDDGKYSNFDTNPLTSATYPGMIQDDHDTTTTTTTTMIQLDDIVSFLKITKVEQKQTFLSILETIQKYQQDLYNLQSSSSSSLNHDNTQQINKECTIRRINKDNHLGNKNKMNLLPTYDTWIQCIQQITPSTHGFLYSNIQATTNSFMLKEEKGHPHPNLLSIHSNDTSTDASTSTTPSMIQNQNLHFQQWKIHTLKDIAMKSRTSICQQDNNRSLQIYQISEREAIQHATQHIISMFYKDDSNIDHKNNVTEKNDTKDRN